jgi:hypothetical protein
VVALYNGAWPCKPAKEDFGRACITYTMFSAVMQQQRGLALVAGGQWK